MQRFICPVASRQASCTDFEHPENAYVDPVIINYRAPKRYFHGTHRLRAPADTLFEISSLFKTAGITRLANITGLR